MNKEIAFSFFCIIVFKFPSTVAYISYSDPIDVQRMYQECQQKNSINISETPSCISFGYEEKCIEQETCEVFMTSIVKGDKIQWQLAGYVGPTTDPFVAIGLITHKTRCNATFIYCQKLASQQNIIDGMAYRYESSLDHKQASLVKSLNFDGLVRERTIIEHSKGWLYCQLQIDASSFRLTTKKEECHFIMHTTNFHFSLIKGNVKGIPIF